jgi:hypothetical protein
MKLPRNLSSADLENRFTGLTVTGLYGRLDRTVA